MVSRKWTLQICIVGKQRRSVLPNPTFIYSLIRHGFPSACMNTVPLADTDTLLRTTGLEAWQQSQGKPCLRAQREAEGGG